MIPWLLLSPGTAPVLLAAVSAAEQPRTGHPRLYFTAEDLPRLRALRTEGVHARIWENLQKSAEECLTFTPRAAWIAPVTPDPVYENLYDRFYAIMGDLAITEHLAFAYAYSGDARYGEAARQWVLASCRAWQHEADAPPDGGKAYAVSRLLKGLAVGYDCLDPLWTPDEREEIRGTLARIGQLYYDQYFTTPTIAGEGFHTHHAIVEWASFGVTALALLGEVEAAAEWLEATVRKFEKHLLPFGLAPDGAQVEGSTFWASTMHYRLFFMDALRRVTGRDLFTPFAAQMNADLALASIAAEKHPGPDEDHQTVILEPSYGQLNYYAPVLLALAREYRQPLFQHLALWDHTLGALQDTRYVTPHGEKLRFELGGYAYVWYDPTVPAEGRKGTEGDGRGQRGNESWRVGELVNTNPPTHQPTNPPTPTHHSPLTNDTLRHFHFPSVDEAYLRESWEPGGIVVGVRKGSVVVHAGGQVVLAEMSATTMPVRRVADDGTVAVIECASKDGTATLTVELHRPGRLILRRQAPTEWSWWSQRGVQFADGTWTWPAGPRAATLRVLAGTVTQWAPEGYRPEMAVGNGLLKLHDAAPQVYPCVTVSRGTGEEVVVEVLE
jgi:hypothetical protein